MKPQTMWFIQGREPNGGRPFLYCGGHLTRTDAISDHEAHLGKPWAYHKRRGDRAVKCLVTLHPKLPVRE